MVCWKQQGHSHPRAWPPLPHPDSGYHRPSHLPLHPDSEISLSGTLSSHHDLPLSSSVTTEHVAQSDFLAPRVLLYVFCDEVFLDFRWPPPEPPSFHAKLSCIPHVFIECSLSSWFCPEPFLELFNHSVPSNSFGSLWTPARQAPLSMGFSRQEYWSG